MHRFLQGFILGAAACAAVCATSPVASAGTIIKLNLGDVSPDLEFDGTTLSTADDGDGSPGDQNTAVEFLDILDTAATDIVTADASFTLDGLTASGQAFVLFGSSVLQNFTGGTFTLYDVDDSTVLLSGNLATSALTGPIGFSGGGLFTTTFGSFTGGTLKDYLAPDSLVLAMHTTGVRSGNLVGFSPSSITGNPPVQMADLDPFTADAAISIEGTIPEPTGAGLFLAAGMILAAAHRQNSRRRGA